MRQSGLWSDLVDVVESRDLWVYLAWQDIRLRYRRSKIGPFWITISMAVFCLALGLIYSQLFKADVREYLPFLSIGFVFWAWISGMLGEFSNLFVDNAAYIKDIRINPLAVLCRMAMRHLISLAHHALIIVAVWLYFGINPGFMGLWVIPGVLLVLLNLLALGITLGLLGARFRDVAPIMQSLIQLIFFVTPLTWLPRLLASHEWVMWANPVASYIDLLRSPLLGQAPALMSWVISTLTLCVFSALSLSMYSRKAGRIPFWV